MVFPGHLSSLRRDLYRASGVARLWHRGRTETASFKKRRNKSTGSKGLKSQWCLKALLELGGEVNRFEFWATVCGILGDVLENSGNYSEKRGSIVFYGKQMTRCIFFVEVQTCRVDLDSWEMKEHLDNSGAGPAEVIGNNILWNKNKQKVGWDTTIVGFKGRKNQRVWMRCT